MRVITPVEIESTTAFSRASTATYYNSSGILQTAANDVVRVNYNPETLEPEGLLTEDAATNVLTYSEQFDNAAWSKTRSSVTANATTAPDGTLTADKLVEDGTASNSHQIVQTFVPVGNTMYTFSIYAKAAERSLLRLRLTGDDDWGDGAGQTNSSFDLVSGSVVSTAGTSTTADIIEVAGSPGWYQLYITATTVAVPVTVQAQIYLQTSSGSISYSGDGASGLYLWGGEVKVGELSSYVPTAATAVTRSADMLGNMVTSTVAEPDLTVGESSWNAATNYSVGQEVIRTTTHKKYINIQAGVNATLPEVDAALDTPTRWVESGSTNRFAMFDTLRNTLTTTTSPLSVVIVPGVRVNSIGLVGMVADEITITVANGYETIYTFTQDLNTREVLDWYDYFFEPFSNIPAIAKFDLPPYTAGNITITLTSISGSVSCGAVIVGNYTDIGNLEYGVKVSGTNFSRIDREFDGTALLTRRQTKPKIQGTTFYEKGQHNKILALKSALNAVPTIWSGLDDQSTDGWFDSLLILGIYKIFDADIAYPENAKLDLEIEEI